MNDDVKFCPKCGTQQVVTEQSNNITNSDDGKFKGGSEFDGDNNVQQASINNASRVQQGSFSNKQQQTNFRNNNQQQYQQQTYEENFTIGQPQHLDFSQSMSYIWANKFDFNPTVQDNQKSIFWWSQLMVSVLGIALYIILGIPASVLDSGFLTIIMMLLDLALWLMVVPPIMRRLNYLGQSKNIAWLFFVPIANLYIWYLMFTDRSQVNHA